MQAHATLRFGRFEWRPAERRLLADGVAAPLGARAIDLLHALIDRRDRVVAKSELLDTVWPSLVVEEANLHVQVSALRKVVGADVIATVPGRGYRFVAPLVDATSSPPPIAPLPPPADAVPRRAAGDLIGRGDELQAIGELLAGDAAVVTIVGAAGIGKTRLARAICEAAARQDAGGVAWVDCAVLGGAELAPATARAAGVAIAGARDAAALAEALRDRRLTLALDNVEHLLDAAAAVAAAVGASAPGVRLLVTSQAPLGVSGERSFRLQPLKLPSSDAGATERFGAIRLFAERVRDSDRDFTVDSDNAAVVGRVCRRLDGLPLAIELAAARVRLLGLGTLADRLDERLDLLAAGSRGAEQRHRTLRTALDWSVSLLEENERAVYRRLGVFVGGFTLELAEQVAADAAPGELDGWAVVDAIGELVDRSLVVADAGDPVRYRLLETMRLDALERLDAAGEVAATRERHARAVTALFVATDEQSMGDGGTLRVAEVLARLVPEADNARAALHWAIGEGADRSLAIELAGAAAGALYHAGRVHEWIPPMRALLPHVDAGPSPVARVNLLMRLSSMGRQEGMSRDDVYDLKKQAVDEARRAGLRRRLLASLGSLAYSQADHGELAAAEATVRELESLERPDDAPILVVQRLGAEMKVREARGDFAGVVESLRRIQALQLGAGRDAANLAITEMNLCLFLNLLGRYDEVLSVAGAELERPGRSARLTAFVYHLVHALVSLGRVDEGLALARARRAELEAHPASVDVQGREVLAMLAAARGRIDDAHRIAAPPDRTPATEPNPFTRICLERLCRASAEAGASSDAVARWKLEGRALSPAARIGLAVR